MSPASANVWSSKNKILKSLTMIPHHVFCIVLFYTFIREARAYCWEPGRNPGKVIDISKVLLCFKPISGKLGANSKKSLRRIRKIFLTLRCFYVAISHRK